MNRLKFPPRLFEEPPRIALLELLGRLLDQGFAPDRALSLAHPSGAALAPWVTGDRLVPYLTSRGLLEPGEETYLEAAEDVGRLPAALAALARELREEHHWRRGSLARSAYPLLVLHFAFFPLQIPRLLASGPGSALRSAVLGLVLFDTVLLVSLLAVQRAWRRGTIERWPLLGPIFLARQRKRALFLLAELHASGVLWQEALARTARAVQAPGLSRTLTSASVHAGMGNPLAANLGAALGLSPAHLGQLTAGEAAGDLEAGLRRCALALEASTQSRQSALARGLGAALYVVAVAITVLVLLRALLAIQSAALP